MESRKCILTASGLLIDIFKKDHSIWNEISSIFFNLSELEFIDEDIRSFCIDAMVVISECVYPEPAVMSFDELEEEYKNLLVELKNKYDF